MTKEQFEKIIDFFDDFTLEELYQRPYDFRLGEKAYMVWDGFVPHSETPFAEILQHAIDGDTYTKIVQVIDYKRQIKALQESGEDASDVEALLEALTNDIYGRPDSDNG